MLITNRTKISLSQLLELFERSFLNILFEKHSMETDCTDIEEIRDSILSAALSSLASLVNEIISTKQDLKSRISPKYRFDERWNDFEKCLFLDGYKIGENQLISIEPTIEGVVALEDDLTTEIKKSTLFKRDEIIQLINESASSFKSNDFNGCLSKARIALETMVRAIAEDKFNFQNTWGSSLSTLKTENFIIQDEENAIASTYTFVSDGSHIPLGFTQEEYARYGRNLIMSVCYFIVKKYKQNF